MCKIPYLVLAALRGPDSNNSSSKAMSTEIIRMLALEAWPSLRASGISEYAEVASGAWWEEEKRNSLGHRYLSRDFGQESAYAKEPMHFRMHVDSALAALSGALGEPWTERIRRHREWLQDCEAG